MMKEEKMQVQCGVAGVPLLFKQCRGTNKKKAGSKLMGKQYKAIPVGVAA